MLVRLLVSVYEKAAFIVLTMLANPFERRDNFSSRRNKNCSLVPKKCCCFFDSELERSSSNCWWKRYW